MAERIPSPERFPFLKPVHLAERMPAVTLLVLEPWAVPGAELYLHTSRFGVQVIFTVRAIDRSPVPEHWYFGAKVTSANYIALEKTLGKNLLTWPGQTFRVSRGKLANGQAFVRVEGARR